MYKSRIILTNGATMSDVLNEKSLADTIRLIKGLKWVSQGKDKNGNNLFITSAQIIDDQTNTVVWTLP